MPPLPPSEIMPMVRADNAMLRTAAASGEVVAVSRAADLVAAIQATYIVTSVRARELALVQDRRELWDGLAQLFNELCACWSGVGDDDPSIVWLRDRLRHFQSLAHEQVRLYSVSDSERLRHAANRGSSIERHNGSEPNGYRDESSPCQTHIYSYCLPKPVRC